MLASVPRPVQVVRKVLQIGSLQILFKNVTWKPVIGLSRHNHDNNLCLRGAENHEELLQSVRLTSTAESVHSVVTDKDLQAKCSEVCDWVDCETNQFHSNEPYPM